MKKHSPKIRCSHISHLTLKTPTWYCKMMWDVRTSYFWAMFFHPTVRMNFEPTSYQAIIIRKNIFQFVCFCLWGVTNLIYCFTDVTNRRIWNIEIKKKDFPSPYFYHCCRLPSIQMLLRFFCHLFREFFFSLFSNFLICDFCHS